LQGAYPEYISKNKPRWYWKNKRNQKAFFDQLALKLNIQKPEDWNNVTTERVLEEEGGKFVMDHYKGSWKKGNYLYYSKNANNYKALRRVYPEYMPDRKPQWYWENLKNQKIFFDQLAVKLNIQKPEDWYMVTNQVIRYHGGHFLSKYYKNSLIAGNCKVLLDLYINQLSKLFILHMNGEDPNNFLPSVAPEPRPFYWKLSRLCFQIRLSCQITQFREVI
jgi:hypothetical protein